MSVTFRGMRGESVVRTDEEEADGIGFNLNMGNARAFLLLLGFEREELWGRKPMAEMVRAVQETRESFSLRVPHVIRNASESCGGRMLMCGNDEEYFVRRLQQFADLLTEWMLLGADGVSWS